jgi:hypothetical protein
MAAKLLETARKLPSGQDRHNALQEIERFRARITAQQRLDLRSAQSPQPYDLVTRPCTIHAGRFRWDIRENGRPIQSSMESFATEQEAHADGRHELEKLIQSRGCNWRGEPARYLEVRCLGCDTHQTVALDIVRRPKTTPIHELERYMRCKDCSQVRGYPYKRSDLVALRPTKISATDPPSTWCPGER